MNDPQHRLDERVEQLRESFDRSFSLPPPEPAEAKQRFLVLGAGADRYAIKLEGLLGVEARRKIARLPLRAPGLLGLAAFRGRMTAVFHLASLLGAPVGPEPPAWLAFCKGETPVALAFDRFEGAAEVPSGDIHAAEPKDRSPRLGGQTVRIGSDILHVIDVPSLTAMAKQSLIAATRGKPDPGTAFAAGIPG
jgi:purine-binding chemotaxis protein CheW